VYTLINLFVACLDDITGATLRQVLHRTANFARSRKYPRSLRCFRRKLKKKKNSRSRRSRDFLNFPPPVDDELFKRILLFKLSHHVLTLQTPLHHNERSPLTTTPTPNSELLNRLSPDLRHRHHHHADGGRHRCRFALRTTTSPLFVADSKEGHRDLLDNLRYRYLGSAADPVLDIMVPHRYVA
jgi:hypothetical protein